MSKITLCVLLFGDHPELAHRCLGSIWERLDEGRTQLRDIRLGLNEIGDSTQRIVDWFTTEQQRYYGEVPLLQYACPRNACKYPLMRRMLLDDARQPGEFVMWFDDDSYLTGDSGWWQHLLQAAEAADMLGKLYWQLLQQKQWGWIARQPWYNPAAGRATYRHKPAFHFATGGWWLVRSEILRRWDWPTVELKHTGGDSMLGELLRQQGYRLQNYEHGVRINADARGRHSKARPRGASRNRELLGADGQRRKDLSHQQFELRRIAFGC